MKELIRRLFKPAQPKDEPYSSYSEPKEQAAKVTEFPQMPKPPKCDEPKVITRQQLIDAGFYPEDERTIIVTHDDLRRFGIRHRK